MRAHNSIFSQSRILSPTPDMAFLEDEVSVKSGDSSSSSTKIKFLCSFGGKIMARPTDNQLRYMGGETRILAVGRNTSYIELMEKLVNLCGSEFIIVKYQLPGEDLDALVSLICDDDIEIMMEEYERLEAIDVCVRLRLFIFSSEKKVMSSDAMAKARALSAMEKAKEAEISSAKKVQNYQATRVSEYLMGQQATIPAASLAPGMVVGRQQVLSSYCAPYVPVVSQVNPLIAAAHSVPPGAVIKQLSSMTLASSVAAGNLAPVVSPIPHIPSLAPVVNPALINPPIPPVVNNPAVNNPLAPVVNPALFNPVVPPVVNRPTPVSAMVNPGLSGPMVNPVLPVVTTPVSGIVNHILSVNPVSGIMVNPIPPVVNNPVSAMVNPVSATSVNPLVNPVPVSTVNPMVNPIPVSSVNPMVNPIPVSAMVNPVAPVNPLVPPFIAFNLVNPVTTVPLVNPALSPGSRAEERVPVAVIAPAGGITPGSAPAVVPVAPYVTVSPVQDRASASTSYVPTSYVQDIPAASRASTNLLSAGDSHAMNLSQQVLMRSGSSGSQHLPRSGSGSSSHVLALPPRSGSGSAHSSFSRVESDLATEALALAANEERIIHSAAPGAQPYYPEKISRQYVPVHHFKDRIAP